MEKESSMLYQSVISIISEHIILSDLSLDSDTFHSLSSFISALYFWTANTLYNVLSGEVREVPKHGLVRSHISLVLAFEEFSFPLTN